MKHTLYVLFTLIASISARAEMVPGRIHYLMGARMKTVEAVGTFEGAEKVRLFTTEKASTREQGIVLEIEGRRRFFHVNNVEQDQCGSLRTTASVSVVNRCGPQERCMGVARIIRVELIDHTKRFCRDYRPYRWQATVLDRMNGEANLLGKLRLVGNPEPMMNTMDERDVQN